MGKEGIKKSKEVRWSVIFTDRLIDGFKSVD
jgi:hypothetical protein